MRNGYGSAVLALIGGVIALGMAQPAFAQANAPKDFSGKRSDAAGNQIVSLAASKAAPANFCSTDGVWCVADETPADDASAAPRLRVEQRKDGKKLTASLPFDDPAMPDMEIVETGTKPVVWPYMVKLSAAAGGGVIVGVKRIYSQMYSGGGANSSALQWFRVTASGSGLTVKPVAKFSTGGDALIRACFSEKDMKKRLGVCHDEYSQDITLELAAQPQNGMPAFIYKSVATAYPGSSRRDKDNSAQQLKKSDIPVRTDPRCTFTRTIRYKAESGSYWFNAALPDCKGYGADWTLY